MSLRLYHNAIRSTLEAALCLSEFASQQTERQAAPEVEMQQDHELLLNPVVISRSHSEKVLIEASINSVRVSLAIKIADQLERYICEKMVRFVNLRAEFFVILRRTPLKVGERLLTKGTC